MATTGKAELSFPTGHEPGWELKEPLEDEEEGLSSIPESGILLQSLKQSRERWLHQSFPKFSSRARGNKNAAAVAAPPPHTIQTRGSCDLHIGPHIFPQTVFYEVHYLSHSSATTSASTWQAKPTHNPYTSSYSSYTFSSVPSAHTSSSTTPSQTQLSSLPRVTAPLASVMAQPSPSFADIPSVELINRVNTAASSDPILSNLLQCAAAGKATPEQIKTLGTLIQDLARLDGSSSLTASSASPAATQTVPSPADHYRTSVSTQNVRDFDLVLEFRETPMERWLLPRGTVVGERIKAERGEGYDIVITSVVPFPTDALKTPPGGSTTSTSSDPTASKDIVRLCLRNAPAAIWDTVNRWLGGEEKMRQSRAVIDGLPKQPKSFLAHRLAPGPILSSFQAANAPSYTLKPLKHGPTPARSRPRKPAAKKTPAADADSSTKPGGPSPPKKAKTNAKLIPVVAPIQCHSCAQADVPLIYGGRYCRPCVESGRWKALDGSLPGSITPSVPPLPTPSKPSDPVPAVTTTIPDATIPSPPTAEATSTPAPDSSAA